MVSIHRPLGYGPSTLPLRHAAVVEERVNCPKKKRKEGKSPPFTLKRNISCLILIQFVLDCWTYFSYRSPVAVGNCLTLTGLSFRF